MEEAKEPDCDQSWRGSPLRDVYRDLDKFDLQLFPPVKVSSKSTVLYEFPLGVVNTKKPPKPHSKKQKCDDFHVRLPNATKCQCSTCNGTENEACQLKNNWELINHWEMIKTALSEPINTVQELQDALSAYNPEFKEQWHFQALHTLLMDDLEVKEVEEFFKDLLPRIINLAFQLPELVQAPIPFLKQNCNHTLSLTQQQVSCLLANAFLCTFPERSSIKRWQSKQAKYKSYSDINFYRLYQSHGPAVTEKLKSLLNYFRRVCPTATDSSNVPNGVVTFIRRRLNAIDFPDWSTCEKSMDEAILHIDAAGAIEDGVGLLQVDFANKYVGGSVLGFGCAQEEIRFSINPELIIAKLFTECLLPNEAVFMIGCEQYNNYSGYGTNFKWTGDHIDKTPCDSSKRRQIYIVAMDAVDFRHKVEQYSEETILRELNKAYAGFLYFSSKQPAGIATGNWGCGAFLGDPRLKALIQLVVACVTDRPLAYFTFLDTALRDDIYKMHAFLKKRKISVCDLYNVLIEFGSQKLDSKDLYRFIKCRLRKQL